MNVFVNCELKGFGGNCGCGMVWIVENDFHDFVLWVDGSIITLSLSCVKI